LLLLYIALHAFGYQSHHFGSVKNNLKERKHFGNTCVDGRIILKCVLKKKPDIMNWIQLAQNK